MTKFVVNDPASTEPACLYLKNPSDEQLDAVMAWLHSKEIDIVTCLEGQAVFTKTGKGKPAPVIAIQFQSRIDFDAVAAKMAELYPAPKSLAGIQLTNHEVTDQATDMPIAPIQSDELADHANALAADAVQHAEAAIAATAADSLQPEPTPLGAGTAVSAKDVPF
jgi:hypothetical protein